MARPKRRQILIATALVLLMGIAVYFRLWTIDYRISANDTELIRMQFDLASREAMDESAEWRRRFDAESEKASKCFTELDKVMKSRGKTTEATLSRNIEMLQKENRDLRERIESLKHELETKKLKCSTQNT